MIEARHRELLLRLGTSETGHSGGTLLEHLEGTCRILQEWGARKELCLAGLFHSVYGTEYFRVASAELSRRAEVRAAIGEEAEQLAYLFCVSDRTSFFGRDPARPEHELRNQRTGELLRVTSARLADLLEMHLANDIEMAGRLAGRLDPRLVRGQLEIYEKHAAWLSPRALEAVRALQTTLQAAPPGW